MYRSLSRPFGPGHYYLPVEFFRGRFESWNSVQVILGGNLVTWTSSLFGRENISHRQTVKDVTPQLCISYQPTQRLVFPILTSKFDYYKNIVLHIRIFASGQRHLQYWVSWIIFCMFYFCNEFCFVHTRCSGFLIDRFSITLFWLRFLHLNNNYLCNVLENQQNDW